MTRFLIPSVALAIFTIATDVQAGGRCCPPVCAPYVCQPVTCYRRQLCFVPVERVVCKPVCREVIVHEKCTVLVPKVYEESRTITCLKPVPHVVEKDVTRCKQVPITLTDSCGRPYHAFKTETYTERVAVTEIKHEIEKKDVIAKVIKYEPEVRDVARKQIVREMVPTTVTRNRLAFVPVPYTTTVRVPAYSPVARSMPPAAP